MVAAATDSFLSDTLDPGGAVKARPGGVTP
jgi:hypothetical protein